METCLNSFDEDVALDVGYVVVEREHQLVILTYGDVSVETAVDDYGYATGVFADWFAESYAGFVQTSALATPTTMPKTHSYIKGATVICLAPFYHAADDRALAYLRTECIDPIVMEIDPHD